jgi:hypothetical protein
MCVNGRAGWRDSNEKAQSNSSLGRVAATAFLDSECDQ